VHSEVNGIFNVGSGESITINQLAELIVNLLGSSIKPIHSAANPGDVRHSLADISRAKALGYAPRYSLERGSRELLLYWRTPEARHLEARISGRVSV
jgi:UDP-glucose 4-epimerase